MDAEINLSDRGSKQDLQKVDFNEKSNYENLNKSKRSMSSYFWRNCKSIIFNDYEKIKNEECVKISKSEYEEIQNLVSAIETRISQEFKNITSDSNDLLPTNTVNIYNLNMKKH